MCPDFHNVQQCVPIVSRFVSVSALRLESCVFMIFPRSIFVFWTACTLRAVAPRIFASNSTNLFSPSNTNSRLHGLAFCLSRTNLYIDSDVRELSTRQFANMFLNNRIACQTIGEVRAERIAWRTFDLVFSFFRKLELTINDEKTQLNCVKSRMNYDVVLLKRKSAREFCTFVHHGSRVGSWAVLEEVPSSLARPLPEGEEPKQPFGPFPFRWQMMQAVVA